MLKYLFDLVYAKANSWFHWFSSLICWLNWLYVLASCWIKQNINFMPLFREVVESIVNWGHFFLFWASFTWFLKFAREKMGEHSEDKSKNQVFIITDNNFVVKMKSLSLFGFLFSELWNEEFGLGDYLEVPWISNACVHISDLVNVMVAQRWFPWDQKWCWIGRSGEGLQFSSLAQSCPTLCNPMNHSTPGLPVHHQLPEFTQLMSIESVMPSSHLNFCIPLLLLSPIPPSIRVLSKESTLRMRWPKYWSFSFSISLSNEHPEQPMDWLDLLAVQGTLKSLLQHHSSKASVLRLSAFFSSIPP